MRSDSDSPEDATRTEEDEAPASGGSSPRREPAAAPSEGAARAEDVGEPDGSPPPREAAPVPPAAPAPRERCNTLLLSLVLFCVVCFSVWVVSAGKRYREEHAQATEGWRVGTTRMIEITVVPADKQNLACASDRDYWGLRCSGRQELGEAGPEPNVLQPFNTTGNQLFLGAGLWHSPDLKGSLPRGRFTVTCDYTIRGVAKSPAIRFSRTGAFAPTRKTVTVGTLTDCVIPR